MGSLADQVVNLTAPNGKAAEGTAKQGSISSSTQYTKDAFPQPRVDSDKATATGRSYSLKVRGQTVPVTVDRDGQTPNGKQDIYKFQLRGRTINVTYPKGMDPLNTPKDITTLGHLAKLFSVQSDEVLNQLSHNTVDVSGKKVDGAWMSAGGGFVNINNYDGNTDVHDDAFADMAGALAHETGHTAQSEYFKPQDEAAWRQAIIRDHGSVSNYANDSYNKDGGQNVWEDFAESWKQYMTVRGTPHEADFRAEFPERWAVLDQIAQRSRDAGSRITPAKSTPEH